MKFYITQQTKDELNNKIKLLQQNIRLSESFNDDIRGGIETAEKTIYEEILLSSIVVPNDFEFKMS